MTCASHLSAPPPPHAPSRLTQLHAREALALLQQHARAVLLDVRAPALFALERVVGAVRELPPHDAALSRVVVVYDSGTACVREPLTPTTPALSALLQLMRTRRNGWLLVLLRGGLPAVAASVPHMVRVADHSALDQVAAALKRRRAPRLAAAALRHLRAPLEPPARVLPWLYVGSARFATAQFVRAARVSVVLCVSDCDTPLTHGAPPQPQPQRGGKAPSVQRIAMRDCAQYDVRQHFERVVALLTSVKAMHGVAFVHCVAGVSRSVCVVLAFLVWQGYRLRDAWQLVSACRRCAAPNDGFWAQLRLWEREVAHMRRCEACALKFKRRVELLRRQLALPLGASEHHHDDEDHELCAQQGAE